MRTNENSVADGKMNSAMKRAFIIANIIAMVAIVAATLINSRREEVGCYSDAASRVFATMGTANTNEYENSNETSYTGYHVDENSGSNGLFTCGPYTEISAGIYDVTVEYKSTSAGNTVYAYSEESSYYANAINADVIKLDKNKSSQTFTIWVNKGLSDFEVQTYYCGEGDLDVYRIIITKGSKGALNFACKALFALTVIDVVILLFIYWKRISEKTKWVMFGLAGITLLASMPVFRDGLINCNTDLNFFLMRVDGLKDGLLSGDFPVRVQPNWLGGYGYATSVFYGDLFLYFPAMLRICGFTIQDAYVSYVLVITAGTAIISYYCMKGVFQSSKLGLLLSCAYTLSAYRLFLTFALTRCGMYTAYMLLPLVVYGVYRIFKTSKTGGWVYLSIAMTGILQTHLLSAEMTALGIFITILMLLKDFLKNRVWLTFIKAVGMSVLINIGFLIPIAEFYLSGNYYCNAAGWDEKWNYIQKGGVEISSLGNVFNQDLTRDSEIIDILLLGAAISFLIFMIIAGKKLIAEELKCYKKIGIVSSIACLIFTYMGTVYFPWDFIEETMPFLRGIINSVQYPQRFFSVGTVLGLVSLGCLVKMVAGYREGRYKRYLLIAIGVLVLIPALWKISLFASESDAKKVYSTAALDSYNISTKEYLPFGCNPDELVNELPYSESVVISSFDRRGLHLTMSLFNPSDRDELVEVPLVYYPHYAATGENSRAIELLESENHTVVASIPAGYSGTVSVAFKIPIMWIIGDVVSGLTCLGAVIYFAMSSTRKRQNTPNLLNK